MEIKPKAIGTHPDIPGRRIIVESVTGPDYHGPPKMTAIYLAGFKLASNELDATLFVPTVGPDATLEDEWANFQESEMPWVDWVNYRSEVRHPYPLDSGIAAMCLKRVNSLYEMTSVLIDFRLAMLARMTQNAHKTAWNNVMPANMLLLAVAQIGRAVKALAFFDFDTAREEMIDAAVYLMIAHYNSGIQAGNSQTSANYDGPVKDGK